MLRCGSVIHCAFFFPSLPFPFLSFILFHVGRTNRPPVHSSNARPHYTSPLYSPISYSFLFRPPSVRNYFSKLQANIFSRFLQSATSIPILKVCGQRKRLGETEISHSAANETTYRLHGGCIFFSPRDHL